MEPTHIPRDQWSTAGAATSSGLSWGHIPRDQEITAGAKTSSGLSRGHIPRDQGFTDGAATSSGLSLCHIPRDEGSTTGATTISSMPQGRASWMWWQNRDEQRAEFHEAINVETAEVMPESDETN